VARLWSIEHIEIYWIHWRLKVVASNPCIWNAFVLY
jgi:hypothetical protein